MTASTEGNTVVFHYTGKLVDGSVFDSTVGHEPMRVTLGRGEVIPGVDEALVGMTPGDTKTVTVDSAQAYGPYRSELVQEVERARIPEDVTVEVGAQLQGVDSAGRRMRLTVVEVDDQAVTLDANHPLAGQNLVFDLELVEIAA